jgi:hypothetical protein
MDKKIGLEHTIRNIVSESIGVSDTSNDRGTMRLEGKIGLEHTIRNIVTEKSLNELKRLDPDIIEIPPVKAPEIPSSVPVQPKPQKTEPLTPAPEKTPNVIDKSPNKLKPDISTKPDTPEKLKPDVSSKPSAPDKLKPDATTKPNARSKFRPFIFPLMNMDGTPISGPRDYVGADIYIHHARSRRTFGEDFNSDAEEIKQKSRKAQIIRKILDEKKKKDTETVNMNPKLKSQDLEERVRFMPTAKGATLGLGAAATAYGTGAVEKSQRAMDSQPQLDTEPGKINPNKSAFAKWLDTKNPLYDPKAAAEGPTGVDYALDAGQMMISPKITIPSGAAAVYRDLRRGDYTDAVLDGIGMFPLGAQAAKGAAWVGSKIGGLVSKAPGLSSSGSRVKAAADSVVNSKSRLLNPKDGGFRDSASTIASGAEIGNLGLQMSKIAGERANNNNTSTVSEFPGVLKDYGAEWGSQVKQTLQQAPQNLIDYAKKLKQKP